MSEAQSKPQAQKPARRTIRLPKRTFTSAQPVAKVNVELRTVNGQHLFHRTQDSFGGAAYNLSKKLRDRRVNQHQVANMAEKILAQQLAHCEEGLKKELAYYEDMIEGYGISDSIDYEGQVFTAALPCTTPWQVRYLTLVQWYDRLQQMLDSLWMNAYLETDQVDRISRENKKRVMNMHGRIHMLSDRARGYMKRATSGGVTGNDVDVFANEMIARMNEMDLQTETPRRGVSNRVESDSVETPMCKASNI